MNVRVTQSSLARSALTSIARATRNIQTSQEQIATARRINRLSDAPLDAARALRLHSSASRLDQYQRNIDQAKTHVENVSSALMDISDLLVQARETCLSGADSTSASARQTMADGVDQMLQTLIGRANASFDGRYLFAGSATDTAPFEAVTDAEGYVESVAYRGDDRAVELDVGPHTRVQTSEPGEATFSPQEADVFDALIGLRDLLLNRSGLSDGQVARALSNYVGQIDAAHEQITDAASRFGWRASQLESSQTAVENSSLASAELLSRLEDTDFAEAVTRLQGQQVALEAALAMAAQVMKHSLLEYLD